MKETTAFCRDTQLCSYLRLPREILNLDLSPTAMLLYGILLNRGSLSQKNGYWSQSGQVYVIYTLEALAGDIHRGVTSVKRCLNELEKVGLIRRERCGMTSPAIFFYQFRQPAFRPSHSPNPVRHRVRKQPV